VLPALRDCVRSGEPLGSWSLATTLTAMRRDIHRPADTPFDLLAVGAGIRGACAAGEESRGLSVAVVDQAYSAAATSATSLRYDDLSRHPARLTLGFLRSAANIGAVPASYLRADRLLNGGAAVQGARMTDCLTRAREAAAEMAAEPGWDVLRQESEVGAVMREAGAVGAALGTGA
jgi:glycerol-3-phosphate dehydrogenase